MFLTKELGENADAVAPDGSDVRRLLQSDQVSMAHFTLATDTVSKAVAHKTIEEIWYFLSGQGWMWRRLNGQEEIAVVRSGVSVTIPTGTHFQFCCESDEPLTAVAVTMPSWPGEGETYEVEGIR